MTTDSAKTLNKDSTMTSPSSKVDSKKADNTRSIALQGTATGIALLEFEGEEIHHGINLGRDTALSIAAAITKYFQDKDEEDAILDKETSRQLNS